MRRIAAIDIGTVTSRLLVADCDGSTLSEVARLTAVTHLGEGLAATGRLSGTAIARVCAALRDFDAVVRDTGAEAIFAVTTSAARDSGNSRDLVDAAADAGVELRVIPGSLEARLAFLGATHGLEAVSVLVADLGGGSTELVMGSCSTEDDERVVQIAASRSLDVGSLRVLDAFLHSDPPRARELTAAAEWVAAEMRAFFDGLREKPTTLITLAGTGTTLSAIQQGLAVYDQSRVHDSRLSGADVADLLAELACMTVEDRRDVVGMDPARADVIVAGSLILETIMALAGVDETVVSEHDILYGIALAGISELG